MSETNERGKKRDWAWAKEQERSWTVKENLKGETLKNQKKMASAEVQERGKGQDYSEREGGSNGTIKKLGSAVGSKTKTLGKFAAGEMGDWGKELKQAGGKEKEGKRKDEKKFLPKKEGAQVLLI